MRELADALRRVVSDPMLRETLTRRMAERHRAITFGSVGAQLIAIYEGLESS